MTTYVRTSEAAQLLGISKASLYSYVSRGRLSRTIAPDGRTSLFARDDLEQLAVRSRRSLPGPRPSIDVQIDSAVTTLGEGALSFRGHDVATIVREHNFEDVAELLWLGERGSSTIASGTKWPTARREDREACAQLGSPAVSAVSKMAIAALTLGSLHPDDDSAEASRRLLLIFPALFGSARKTGPYALRLVSAWRRQPQPTLVTAVDTALSLLADHGLATSTLAVRIAASVRTTPYEAIAAGLATVQGALHGSASAEAHRFLARCADRSPAEVIREMRSERQFIPGFGHKVYRGVDPRFEPMLRVVEPLDRDGEQMSVLRETLAEVGRSITHPPNIDLALGALSWIARLEPDVPIFAVARTAGWAAHYAEEIEEAPVRFRGIARTP